MTSRERDNSGQSLRVDVGQVGKTLIARRGQLFCIGSYVLSRHFETEEYTEIFNKEIKIIFMTYDLFFIILLFNMIIIPLL